MAKTYEEKKAAFIAKHGITPYEDRIQKAHAKGLSTKEGRGYHPTKAEKAERAQRAPQPKPTTQPTQKAPEIKALKGTRGYGKHIHHQYNEQGERVRTRVNAKSTSSLHKAFDRVPAGQGVILHFVNSQTGQKVKAVAHGRNHTANVNELRRYIKDAMDNGMSFEDAFFGAVSETYDLYDSDGNAVAFAPSEFTNIIMYTEAE